MRSNRIIEDEIPYFSWDRPLTVGQIKKQLREQSGLEWCRTAAWIMREAAFPDVWIFLTPKEVWDRFDQLEPFLSRKKTFWAYILITWHGLGKV